MDSTPAHIECFLAQVVGKFTIVFLIRNSRGPKFASALRQVEKAGQVPLRGVHFVVGSPVSRRCLGRCGAGRARAVLLLSNAHFMPWTQIDRGGYADSGSPDTDTLLTLAKVRPLLRPGCALVVELLRDASLGFLHATFGPFAQPAPEHEAWYSAPDLDGESGSKLKPMPDLGAVYLWPLFAAGQVYASSSLTTLATQAVFRPSVVRILEELLALPRPAPAPPANAAAAAPPRGGTTRVACLVGQEGDGGVGLW
eukprot:CAMPEP_0206363556 /NCGR_PEP_ID=MMETSP0294-20121207/1664_1 /ASSEMBLY_ACC=CAM_ASM_000327 /TAXON_ID=39354 /ORGANISM="Heterosigma akashiwo, Strain CCMP2393" /LENGTH=253 /DNA_ID=CAMNT_0053808927 /DNA_START=92 /DNA_END=850 /DNA_ORIENTATION=-